MAERAFPVIDCDGHLIDSIAEMAEFMEPAAMEGQRRHDPLAKNDSTLRGIRSITRIPLHRSGRKQMASKNSKLPNQRARKLAMGLVLMPLLLSSHALAANEIGGKPEKTEIVVSYPSPSGAFTPIWVAYDAGFFKKYGLDAKLQLLNPQVSTQAVVSEGVDISPVAPDLMNARLRGAPTKVFGSTLHQFVFELWAIKQIADVQDLKGKTVALTTPRSALDISTREALKKSGLIPDKDVKFLYVQTVPAILTSVMTGKTPAGSLSAPNTLKARDAGLNLVVDIAKLNIPGFQVAYGTTERYLKSNPNTIYAFLKAIAEGVVLSKKDPVIAKRAIVKYAQIDEAPMVDATYDAFAPYWEMGLAVRAETVQAHLGYADEKEFPQAKNADAKDFFDNSFVNNLERSGFFKQVGLERQK
jgi:NitT/TauT family transport system substrate-binding protein